MEVENKLNSFGKGNQNKNTNNKSNNGVILNKTQSNFNNFQGLIVCKVKFSAFSEYENICFLPNYFDELVKIFSKAFFPNDFSVIYIDSYYQQHSIHSNETYEEILAQINNTEKKEINSIKFQIILHDVNNVEFKKENEKFTKEENKKFTERYLKINKNEKFSLIKKTIQQIFNEEKRYITALSNQNILLSQDNQRKNNLIASGDNYNNYNSSNLNQSGSLCSNTSIEDNYYLKSPTSNSCMGFGKKSKESFNLGKKDFSLIDYDIESLSDCGKIKANYKRYNTIFKNEKVEKVATK